MSRANARTLALGILLLPALHTFAATADLKADWSNTNNPNAASYGAWQFNQGTTPLSAVSNWYIIPGVQGWGPAANTPPNGLPFIFKTASAALTDSSTSVGPGYQLGDIVLHSRDIFNGLNNGEMNITWTSPGNDTVAITGNLWPTRTLLQRENKYTLILNPAGSNTVLASGFLTEDGSVTRANPSAFNINPFLIHPGDVLDLRVEVSGRAAGVQSTGGDFAGVNFSITSVPEPASLTLLALGGTLLIRRRVRR